MVGIFQHIDGSMVTSGDLPQISEKCYLRAICILTGAFDEGSLWTELLIYRV